eukprot:COSAG05_NODE_181_length_14767_cov_9.554859_3_plen_287_part_00
MSPACTLYQPYQLHSCDTADTEAVVIWLVKSVSSVLTLLTLLPCWYRVGQPSDHSGQWGVAYCKMLPYEEDVRIPMFVRLPASATRPASPTAHLVTYPTLNIDVAPFLLDLAGFEPDLAMDGRSFLPALEPAEPAASAGRAFLIEYFPIPTQGEDKQVTAKGEDGWCTDPDVRRPSNCPSIPVVVDSVNNTWACVRSLDADHLGQDEIFCNFYDGTGYNTSFIHNRSSSASNFEEYYNMAAEWWQLKNLAGTLTSTQKAAMQLKLQGLMACGGVADCEGAAQGRVI